MLDKKAYLAIVLSLAIWMGWQKFYFEPIQQRAAVERQKQEEQAKLQKPIEPSPRADVASAPTVAADQSKKNKKKKGEKSKTPVVVEAVKTVVLENGDAKVTLSNELFALKGYQVRNFSGTHASLGEEASMAETAGFGSQFKIRFGESGSTPGMDQVWTGIEQKGGLAAETALQGKNVQGVRRFVLDEKGFGGRIEYRLKFENEPPKFVFLDLYGSPSRAVDKEGSIFGQAPDKMKVNFRDLNGRHSHIGASLKENVESAAGVRWLGLDDRYFTLAVVPAIEGSSEVGAQVALDTIDAVPAIRGSLVFPTNGKHDLNIVAKVYFGPKDMARLTSVDPLLSDTIDFGWTSFIAIPLLQGLKWLYKHVNNYGLAIILLTFLIKMLLFPLMYKSMKSMAKMSKLQPQLNALREKYKDDKEKLNVEMMSFMKANGYNPIGGCLPILLQMPIFFALYRVLFNSTELLHAPFGLWIHDLSSPDPFFVTPVLLTGLMYLQQKLSPNTAADPAQQKMLQIMPVMFGAFMLMLPSGLTIYMVVNSAVSIGQQWYLNHKLGITRSPAAPAKA